MHAPTGQGNLRLVVPASAGLLAHRRAESPSRKFRRTAQAALAAPIASPPAAEGY